MLHSNHLSNRTLACLVGLGLILATLCNGLGSYLKSTGLLEGEAYRAYWEFHCERFDSLSPAEAMEARCCSHATAADLTKPSSVARDQQSRALTRYVYKTTGFEWALKLAKDMFTLMALALSLVLVARRAAPLPAPLAVWPVGVLLGYIALSACVSFVLHDPAITFIGLRSFMFLGIAVLGLWLVPHLPIIAACVATLLVVEAALIPWELLRSVHLHGHFYALPFTGRVSGTLVLPNTLGAFAVVALAFYYAFASTRRWLIPLSVLAFGLVALSGSATGVICVGVFLLVAVIDLAAPNKRRFLVICGVLCIAILLALMPMLTGRPKVFDSFFAPGARLDGIYTALTDREPLATMFGSGLGLGSNAASSALHAPATAALFSPSARAYSVSAESTVATLLTQIGVLGTLLFYALIGWAAFRDQRARMFYIVVMICSLTLKITELFPVNFLLGVALAHSVSLGATKRE